jgi:hypothetical protein
MNVRALKNESPDSRSGLPETPNLASWQPNFSTPSPESQASGVFKPPLTGTYGRAQLGRSGVT